MRIYWEKKISTENLTLGKNSLLHTKGLTG